MRNIGLYFKKGLLTFGCLLLALVACTEDADYELLDGAKILTEIKLNVTDPLPLLIGTDSLLPYTVGPDDATTKELVWTSVEPEIVTVDETGRIYAHKLGETTINVQAKAGSVAVATLKIQVVGEIIPVEDICLVTENPEVAETARIQLESSVKPLNATYFTVKWTCDTPELAFVTEDGLLVGIKAGIAKVRATATDGSNFSKVFDVKVTPAVPVEDISFKKEAIDLGANEIMKNAYTVVPSNATVQALIWSSSNDNVATVDAMGTIVGRGYGTAEITVASSDGTKSAKMKVTVVKGLLGDNAEGLDIYTLTNAGTKELKEDRMTVTFAASATRSDLKRGGTYFNADKYPIVAIKTGCGDISDKFWHNVNFIRKVDGKNKTCKYSMDKTRIIKISDDTRVYYVNLKDAGSSDTTEGYFNEGEKYADEFTIDTGCNNTKFVSYDVYWVRTFKSVEELEAYIGYE